MARFLLLFSSKKWEFPSFISQKSGAFSSTSFILNTVAYHFCALLTSFTPIRFAARNSFMYDGSGVLGLNSFSVVVWSSFTVKD